MHGIYHYYKTFCISVTDKKQKFNLVKEENSMKKLLLLVCLFVMTTIITAFANVKFDIDEENEEDIKRKAHCLSRIVRPFA